MPRRIFLLGPDQWDDGHAPDTSWAPHVPAGEATPKLLRSHLAARIRHESGGRSDAFVMDDSLGPPDVRLEPDDLFEHIRETRRIDAYFFILPACCKQYGTTWEEGFLNALHRRAPLNIQAFPQRAYLNEDLDGQVQLQPGHRTAYNRALFRIACNVQTWDTVAQLDEGVVNAAIEDLSGASPRIRTRRA